MTRALGVVTATRDGDTRRVDVPSPGASSHVPPARGKVDVTVDGAIVRVRVRARATADQLDALLRDR